MKLKITDEKLDELASMYEYPESSNWDEEYQSFCDGFRAAEQEHQITVDKLMEIIEMQKGFIESCIDDGSDCVYENNIELSFSAFEVRAEVEKLNNELNEIYD